MSIELPHTPIKLLTIDLWDTILRRDIDPDEVKLATAGDLHALIEQYFPATGGQLPSALEILQLRRRVEHAIGTLAKTTGKDDEYEINEVLTATVFSILDRWGWRNNAAESAHAGALDTAASIQTAVEKIVQSAVLQEVQFEAAHSSVDVDIAAVVQKYSPQKIVIVSDFYLSADKLRTILKDKTLPFQVDDIVVSCDEGYNKRGGRLYEIIGKRYGADRRSWVHIGDNPYSDIFSASRYGITAELYSPSHWVTHRGQHSANFCHNVASNALSERKAAQTLLHKYSALLPELSRHAGQTESSREAIQCGLQFAPAYFGFATWLAQQISLLTALGARPFFLMREGEFFNRILGAAGYTTTASGSSELLRVSRLSTFGPSLKSVNQTELMRLWMQYSTMSVRTLLATLGCTNPTLLKLAQTFGINPDTPLSFPWLNRELKAYLEDPFVAHAIADELDQSRSTLLRYLAHKGFTADLEAAVVVDVGWRGSIQDSLCNLFPRTTIFGLYLGLQSYLVPQPQNSLKHGYLFDANLPGSAAQVIEPVTPFEMISNSLSGSVVAFTEGVEGAEPQPLCQVVPEETAVFLSFTNSFQRGVCLGLDALRDLSAHTHPSADALREETRGLWRGLVEEPPVVVAQAFSRLSHNETFGCGELFSPELHPEGAAQLIPTDLDGMIARARSFRWPHAYLRLYQPHLLPIWSTLSNN